MSRSVTFLSFAIALAASPIAVFAQTPTTTPPPSAPAAAPAAAAASTAVPKAGQPTQCEKARQLVVDQQRMMALRAERAAKDKKDSEDCKPADACKKRDRRLASYEQGRKNDEARLARLQADADKACKPN